jgi:hypothetical protein
VAVGCEFQKKNLPKSLNNSSLLKSDLVNRRHESDTRVYTSSELPLFLSKVWPVSRSEAKLFSPVSFLANDLAFINREVLKIKREVAI